jgi:hypothetical protein
VNQSPILIAFPMALNPQMGIDFAPAARENATRFPEANGGVCFAIAALEPRALGYTIQSSGCRIGDFRMLKNRTIAIAISSALLALSQVAAASAATPLATIRAAARPTDPLRITHPPGDFDRAFIAQQNGESWIQELQTRMPQPMRRK